jgi:hypothetical protein
MEVVRASEDPVTQANSCPRRINVRIIRMARPTAALVDSIDDQQRDYAAAEHMNTIARS